MNSAARFCRWEDRGQHTTGHHKPHTQNTNTTTNDDVGVSPPHPILQSCCKSRAVRPLSQAGLCRREDRRSREVDYYCCSCTAPVFPKCVSLAHTSPPHRRSLATGVGRWPGRERGEGRMRLITHNMLKSNIKGVETGFPLGIEVVKTEEHELEFNAGVGFGVWGCGCVAPRCRPVSPRDSAVSNPRRLLGRLASSCVWFLDTKCRSPRTSRNS